MGDINGDGFVGQSDLSFILSDWGEGTPFSALASIASVPEPPSVLFLATAGLGWLVQRWLRRQSR